MIQDTKLGLVVTLGSWNGGLSLEKGPPTVFLFYSDLFLWGSVVVVFPATDTHEPGRDSSGSVRSPPMGGENFC